MLNNTKNIKFSYTNKLISRYIIQKNLEAPRVGTT